MAEIDAEPAGLKVERRQKMSDSHRSVPRQSRRVVMLLALTSCFALSQSYRTVAALMAPQLQAEFAATPRELGAFAGAFHLAFGAMQIVVGLGIDLHGIRRTVLSAFPLAVAGSLVAVFAHRFEWLDPFTATLSAISVFLVAGALAFTALPRSASHRATSVA